MLDFDIIGVDGESLGEWMREYLPWAIVNDAVSFYEIVLEGRGAFELSGAELQEFVREAIRHILRFGGVPIYWHPENKKALTVFGTTEPEIVEGIVAEWSARGEEVVSPHWIYFVHSSRLGGTSPANPT